MHHRKMLIFSIGLRVCKCLFLKCLELKFWLETDLTVFLKISRSKVLWKIPV